MAETTAISWTDHTFNPWIGCTKVGPGCDNCYAAVSTPARALGVAWGHGQPRRRTAVQTWRQPKTWNLRAKAAGVRRKVFCASLADVFDNAVAPAWRADLWELIEACPDLDWIIVTKRISNVADMVPESWRKAWPKNVWLLITVTDQNEADRDIPRLLELADDFGIAVPGLSIEPLLGPIVLRPEWLRKLKWIIVGGESGPNARATHPEWVNMIAGQAFWAGVAFFFKQWGEWRKGTGFEAHFKQTITTAWTRVDSQLAGVRPAFMVKVGKKAAGDLLDGHQHHNWPSV